MLTNGFLIVLFCITAVLPARADDSVNPLSESRKDPASEKTKDNHSFAGDLERNFVSLFSSQNITPLVAGSCATGVSLTLDSSINDHFKTKDETGTGNDVGDFLGNEIFLATGTTALFVVSRISNDPVFRNMGYSMTQGMILNAVITLGIKEAVHRSRPNHGDDLSFPSGHTSSMFTIATVLNRYYGAKIGIPAYFIATFVGYTRVATRAHYLSDVVAGATLGYIVGRTVSREKNHSERHLTWTPAFSSQGDGFGLMLTIQF